MSELVYLAAALVISVVGSVIVWLRHRKPSSVDAGIQEFSRELKALSPELQQAARGSRKGTRKPG